MINRIFSKTHILEKALDATWKRNEAISHNIANVDTPGYKTKKVVFEEELAKALSRSEFHGKKTRDKHISIGSVSVDDISPEIVEIDSTKLRVDENNVDIDAEMTALATNTIRHHALVQKLNGEIQRLKTIINEGRR